jgi:hypothetical protein
MGSDSSTPVMLRRLAALEATVGQLGKDLSSLRSAIRRRGAEPSKSPMDRSRSGAAGHVPSAWGSEGLRGATARGEAARLQWVRDDLVVPGEQLARAWGLTRQALAAAADRGETFSVKVRNRLYYPRSFLGFERDAVAGICRALGELTSTEKLMFWLRRHGSLGGQDVATALQAGIPIAKIERLAGAWARERGAARVAAAA